ncbi:MAG: YfiR family protein [Pelomonas sp.]|nr:YfiR family protein [Roseateles sp.]
MLLLGMMALPAASRANGEASTEYQIKAAFVCKFGNYVEWPAEALGRSGEPFRIGVLGDEAVLEVLRRTAAAASVAGRPVEMLPLSRADLPDGLHAIYITRSVTAQAASALAAARGRPILTITELDQGRTAGMINFVIVDDKVRFDIQLPAAAQSGLKISARLLGVARRIEGRN